MTDLPSLDRQLVYWNSVGPTKPFSFPLDVDRLGRLLEPDSAILDFGCGYGRVLSLLRERGFRRIAGADPSSAMVAAARQRLPEAVALDVMTDPPHVPRPDASFDAVLLVGVLTCVPGDDDQRAMVAEVRRLLKPRGLLLVSDLWLQTDDRNRERYARGVEKYGRYGVFDLPEGVTLRHHDRAWMAELTTGFQVVALENQTVVTMNDHRARGFQWIGRWRG